MVLDSLPLVADFNRDGLPDLVTVVVESAGPRGTPGLDQINVRLLPGVRGQPPFSFGVVTVSVDGVPANGAWLQFR